MTTKIKRLSIETDKLFAVEALETARNLGVVTVEFSFQTGLKRKIFRNVRLVGSWNANGEYSDHWTSFALAPVLTDDGCESFSASIDLTQSQVGWTFHWVVLADVDGKSDVNIVATEVRDAKSTERKLSFVLEPPSLPAQQVTYRLLNNRWLGAQKLLPDSLRFSVWAPNARRVEVVFGKASAKQDAAKKWIVDASGYIADFEFASFGIDTSILPKELQRSANNPEVWTAELRGELFSDYDHKPYMYRITRDDNSIVYRTDLYSRCQIGSGDFDPLGKPYHGSYKDLDGTKSCSVIIDPDTVAFPIQEADSLVPKVIAADEFWADEYDQNKPVPRRVEDLVIYELHIGSLGNIASKTQGTFDDAIAFLDYLSDLGVNTVELLPMSEFGGAIVWGYGTSHYFALEFSAGGRDKFKHFVKACHKRGVAVLMDVCYNHFAHNADRAEYAYDSSLPEKNIYYWYEGKSGDYEHDNGGYIDNYSTGYCPRFHEEMVRKLFISSAAALMEEFHVDGFRVDLTDGIHRNNVLHADGKSTPNVNQFGQKFLREWTRTLKLINPNAILIAEDHTGWDKVTEALERGGLGFDAHWYVAFSHHLVGNRKGGTEWAKLIDVAGFGNKGPLAMDYFAGALRASGDKKVVYHTSHDEAGNADGSMRTIVSACNGAPLIGDTRKFAESRLKFALGMTLLSAGTPMILMGEEVGCRKPFTYSHFLENRENIPELKAKEGKSVFEFCQRLINLRLNHQALKEHHIDVVYVHNENRIIAFKRWSEGKQFLVVGSLNNSWFGDGYFVNTAALGNREWKEVFNSEGKQTLNGDGKVSSNNYGINVKLPPNGIVVLSSKY